MGLGGCPVHRRTCFVVTHVLHDADAPGLLPPGIAALSIRRGPDDA
jgi:hypothetical protein